MDYIETVLRRQQRLWEALLACPGERERPEERAGGARRDPGAVEAPGRRSAGEAAETPEEAGQLTLWEPVSTLARAPTEPGSTPLRGARTDPGEAETAAGAAWDWGAEASFPGRPVASRAASPGEAVPEEAWAEAWGAGDNAPRDLSLFLERDARRYDGGFPLY